MIPILLLALAFEAPERCSVSGTVVDSVTGKGVAKVQVELLPVDRLTHHSATAMTDADGRFSMVDVDPGAYRLMGNRARYLDARKVMLQLDSGQKLEGITHKLVPAAVIAGTIRDADGEPVEGAHVVAARRLGGGRVEGAESTDTDDQGNYRFGHLRAGSYLVAVTPTPQSWERVDHSPSTETRMTPVLTFYPRAGESAFASAVTLRPGGRRESVDITLLRSPTFRVRGRLVNADTRMVLALWGAGQTIEEFGRTTMTRPNGEFEFRGVPPGTYVLAADGPAAQVTVGASDVEGLEVAIPDGGAVRGRVTVEGESGRKLGGRVFLRGGIGGQYPPQVGADGSFAIRHVPAGTYRVEVRLQDSPDLYVKSVRSGDVDVLANGLSLTGSGTAILDVVMAKGGQIGGVVSSRESTVVVVGPETRAVNADPFGRFSVTGLRPGEYRVYAWEDVEEDAWLDPEFLKGHEGQRVTVGEGEARTVEVKVLE
jgi:protocatechuate 3,4-dioxygenase beta subunit